MTFADADTFGKRIKYYRRQKNLTSYTLAALVGVARNTISGIENGAHFPNAARVQHIARVLGVPAGDLFPATWQGPLRHGSKGRPGTRGRQVDTVAAL